MKIFSFFFKRKIKKKHLHPIKQHHIRGLGVEGKGEAAEVSRETNEGRLGLLRGEELGLAG